RRPGRVGSCRILFYLQEPRRIAGALCFSSVKNIEGGLIMECCDDLAAVMYLEYVEEAGGPKWFD
ncbi:MAG TPA: hypothetical protein PK183_07395, partial [Bacillota bacterium]|nr:hypothetical protein [Bacillota bacterium]